MNAVEAIDAAGVALRAYEAAIEQVCESMGIHHHVLISERRTDTVFALSKARELALLECPACITLSDGQRTVDDYLLHLSWKVQLGVLGAVDVDEAALVVARIGGLLAGQRLIIGEKA